MKKRIVWITGLVLAGAVALLVVWGRIDWTDRSNVLAALYGGPQGLDLIAHPDRIEAYRLAPQTDEFDSDKATLADYRITSGPIAVPNSVAATISEALSAPGSYMWDSVKGCHPSFEVRLTFLRGLERIDVLFCFGCMILRAAEYENFDYAMPAMVRAVKAIFPNDPEIQRLREDGRRSPKS